MKVQIKIWENQNSLRSRLIESINLLQLGQIIFNVLICPLNKRFWQYGQKYQRDKFTFSLSFSKLILFIVSLKLIFSRQGSTPPYRKKINYMIT